MTRLHKRQYFLLGCIPFFHLPSASLRREVATSELIIESFQPFTNPADHAPTLFLLPGGLVVYAWGETHDEGNI